MTSTTWKCQELEKLIREAHGEDQARRLKAPLKSIPWRIWGARYHTDLARGLVSKSFPVGETSVVDYFKLVFPSEINLDKRKDHYKNQIEVEFNVIAAGQAMHSAVDLLSNVIFECFPNEPQYFEIKEKQRNIFKARKFIETVSPDLSRLIEHLTGSESFLYLQAYANAVKHQTLIEINSHADCVNNKVGFRNKSFEYVDYLGQRETKAAKDIFDFFEDLDCVSKQIVEIGSAISEVLKESLSQIEGMLQALEASR